jgi:hypothetical protein
LCRAGELPSVIAVPLIAGIGDAAALTTAALILGIPRAVVVLIPGIRTVRR